MFLSGSSTVKLELKPYLQPFERVLAFRELEALVGKNVEIAHEYGLHVLKTDTPTHLLQERLTYWQRVGRDVLVPTLQKALEFTQSGTEKSSTSENLHGARRLRYGPHDLHEYRGKFFPQLVHSLINISGVEDDAVVLDPMCGSGTTPCEVVASGRRAIASDLNPLSVLISTLKSQITLVSPDVFQRSVNEYLSGFKFSATNPQDIWSDQDFDYLKRWFAPRALRDLAAILRDVRAIPSVFYRSFFEVCVSNIVRSVSWQKDVDLRVRKEVTDYASGHAIQRFVEEVSSQTDRIYPYLCMLPRSARIDPDIRIGDATDVAKLFPDYVGCVDLLVTSPPYATALPYLDTDRLSLIAMGLLPRQAHKDTEWRMVGTREISERQRRETWTYFRSRKQELPGTVVRLIEAIGEANHATGVGFRRRNLPALLGKYFLNMMDAMRSAHSLMKPGAIGYYVVGNNSTVVSGQKMEIPTDQLLVELGAAAGWQPSEVTPMELLVSRDIFKENRGSSEAILSFTA